MDEKDVFCVACGEGIVVNLDHLGQDIECPACHTKLWLDEADEDDTAENDIEWSPEVDDADAARVFGLPESDAEESEPPAERQALATGSAPTEKRNSSPLFFGLLTLTSIGFLGWYAYQETHRAELLEQRLEFLEKRIAPMKRTLVNSGDALSQISELQENMEALDDAVSEIASVLRLQNANSLQNDYAVQNLQKNLIRQQSELGKTSLRLATIEHEVGDKSRNAKEAFELSVKRRKEADEASLPIRRRIRELEERKNLLFAQYRAGSIARRPQGVVSKGRASKMMKDYEKKAAPLLAQIQEEIAKVREVIEGEEDKIDALYQ